MGFLSKNGQSSNAFGFTLLELLISLTIFGIIIVIIFGSLRIGARAWEKGEADMEAQQRERVVLRLLKQQIASICIHEIVREEGEPYLFKGEEKSMEFISALPVAYNSRSGVVYVKYVVNGDKNGDELLSLYEQDLFIMESKGIQGEPDEMDLNVLLPHVRQIGFEYLKKTEDENDGLEWQKTWEPDSEEGFPSAVRITYQRDKDSPPIRVITPIYPQLTSNKSG